MKLEIGSGYECSPSLWMNEKTALVDNRKIHLGILIDHEIFTCNREGTGHLKNQVV